MVESGKGCASKKTFHLERGALRYEKGVNETEGNLGRPTYLYEGHNKGHSFL
jgi:hypothetical protein